MGALTLILAIFQKLPAILTKSKAAWDDFKAFLGKHGDAELNAKLDELMSDDVRRQLISEAEAAG